MRKADPKNNNILDSNKVNGQSAEALQRQKALTALEAAKAIESKKIAKGYVYMHMDKTSKFVNPDNIESNLKAGWKL